MSDVCRIYVGFMSDLCRIHVTTKAVYTTDIQLFKQQFMSDVG